MSHILELLCSRFSPRAAALALMTMGVAACSADTSRFNSNPESTRPISQTQTTQVPQPHRNSRLRRHSSPTSTSPTIAPPAAAPQITGSVGRKPNSAAKPRSRNGGAAITVAAGETVDTIARLVNSSSTEPHRAGGDFATRWPELSKPTNSDAGEPTTINDSHADKHEPVDAQVGMPLVWPVLTEAERAGPPDSAGNFILNPAFLAGALAMVLLVAGAIIKLARRHT